MTLAFYESRTEHSETTISDEGKIIIFVWQRLFNCDLIDVDILDKSVDPHFTSISLGGSHATPIGQIFGYVERPEYVDYLTSKAKTLREVLKKYGQTN